MPAANFLRSGKASSFNDYNRDNAFQTNLLALNATAEVAKNTADLIEGTIKKIKDGSDLVAKTNEAFKEVSERSSKVGELVAEISAASNEQAHGIDQVNKLAAFCRRRRFCSFQIYSASSFHLDAHFKFQILLGIFFQPVGRPQMPGLARHLQLWTPLLIVFACSITPLKKGLWIILIKRSFI